MKLFCCFSLIFTFFTVDIIFCIEEDDEKQFSLLKIASDELESSFAVQETETNAGEKTEADDGREIVGGVYAKKGEFPWVVGIRTQYGAGWYNKCGGSILNKRWVLSAAHCFVEKKKCVEENYRKIKVVAGDYDIKKKEPEELHIKVCSLKLHPQYTCGSFHDVALVKLCKDVIYTPYIQTISLAYKGFNLPSSSSVTVAGWGHTKYGGQSSRYLRKVTVKTFHRSTCKETYYWIIEGQFCAGIENYGGKDSCNGDSGGPLWYNKRGKIYQVGIVSFGKGCGEPVGGVYTSVAYYRNWIDGIMDRKDATSNISLLSIPPISIPPFTDKHILEENA